MTLEELVIFLEKRDQKKVVPFGFKHPHSYRGNYMCLAFELTKDSTIGDMLYHAKQSMGRTFPGYKWGKFRMRKDTEIYIAESYQSGKELTPDLLKYLIGETHPRRAESLYRQLFFFDSG